MRHQVRATNVTMTNMPPLTVIVDGDAGELVYLILRTDRGEQLTAALPVREVMVLADALTSEASR